MTGFVTYTFGEKRAFTSLRNPEGKQYSNIYSK